MIASTGAYIPTEKARAADGVCGVTGKFWEQLPRQESVVEVALPQDFSPGLDVATAPTTLPDFCRGLVYAVIGVAVVVGITYGVSHVLNVGGHWLINYLAAQTR